MLILRQASTIQQTKCEANGQDSTRVTKRPRQQRLACAGGDQRSSHPAKDGKIMSAVERRGGNGDGSS